MGTTDAILQRLQSVFKPDQARVLAEVIADSYEKLVKTSDFNELKAIVKELAQSQKRTEQRVEELAQSQQELAIAQHRTEQKVEELAQAQQKTEKEIRNLARQVGGLSESFGGSLEDFAIDLVPELLEKHWQMQIEDAGRDEFAVPHSKQSLEVDLAIRGRIEGNAVLVLGEVKSNLTSGEAERFLEVANRIKEALTETPLPEVRVIFFGYRANKEARQLIKERGAYMIFTHGKIL
jgi:hypothetical protein